MVFLLLHVFQCFPMVSISHSQLKGQIKHLYKALIQDTVGSPGSHMNAKDEVPYFQQRIS